MKLIFAEQAWEDYLYWQKTDRKILFRINELIQEISRSPFKGTGKPEPLKHALSGYWSRRIDAEHRIVYKVVQDAILIAQLRYHYR
uniref:Toxin YoeB n=1 Tax=Desulfatirhabdium butyrativorans TaxID=340467 RepID=A0A7C4MM31_9BACT